MMVGIDLVQISELKRRLEKTDLEKVFSAVELSQNKSLDSLAGIFAAKEAFFKALGKKENWRDVWIEKSKSGQPLLYSTLLSARQKVSISISHAGDYAIAIVIIE